MTDKIETIEEFDKALNAGVDKFIEALKAFTDATVQIAEMGLKAGLPEHLMNACIVNGQKRIEKAEQDINND